MTASRGLAEGGKGRGEGREEGIPNDLGSASRMGAPTGLLSGKSQRKERDGRGRDGAGETTPTYVSVCLSVLPRSEVILFGLTEEARTHTRQENPKRGCRQYASDCTSTDGTCATPSDLCISPRPTETFAFYPPFSALSFYIPIERPKRTVVWVQEARSRHLDQEQADGPRGVE